MRRRLLQRLDSSIKARLAAVISVAVLLAVVVASVASAWREADRRFRSTEAELRGIAAAISAAVARPLAAGARGEVTQTLVAIRQIPSVTFAEVIDSSGHVAGRIGQGVIIEPGDTRVMPNSRLSLLSPGVLRN